MPYLHDADFSCDRIKFGRCGQNIETAFRVNGPQGVFVISDRVPRMLINNKAN